MTYKPRFDPMPPAATSAALDLALRPFCERFVREDRRERASAAFGKPKCDWAAFARDVDTRRGRTYATAELTPWHATPGVFLIEHDAFSLPLDKALELYAPGAWLFVSYGATFAVLHDPKAASLLLT
ncbi:MAG TPA: hypothetical protein VGM88_11785 [Kofleriaceae bacterium]|jgi:hypothetical protein